MKISRKGYYSNISVQFEIIHQLIHRETMFIPYIKDEAGKWKVNLPIRWINASYIDMLKRHWQQFGFLEKDMNLYHSLATYKNFPCFSYVWRYKYQQQQIWLKKFQEYITKYDLFLETDSQDLSKSVLRDGKTIKLFLDEYKIKYCVSFSGSKGLHFIVSYEEFTHLGLPVVDVKGVYFDIVNLFKLLAQRIKAILGCDTIDTSVQDIKRVCKAKYSWDVKSGKIALPLTDDQLFNFNLEIVEPINVLKAGVHKRGLLYRNTDVPKEQREQYIIKLFKDLDIDLEKYK